MNDPAAPQQTDDDLPFYEDDAGLNADILRHRREIVLTLLAGLLVLAAAVFTATKFLRVRRPASNEVLLVAHQAVKRQIGPGLSVAFAPEAQTVRETGASQYAVSGTLMASGSQGLPFYYAFQCVVEETIQGELRVAALTVTPLF